MSMRTRPLRYLFTRSQLAHVTTTCPGCHRFLATTAAKQAGHNKWSKTKHIKAVTDKKKMADRTHFAKTIAMYSRMFGEDLQFNPQLANAVTAATKASIPKYIIDGAIARGQGRSLTGAKLESITVEAIVPPNVAIIAEIETDNKTRTISDLKLVLKKTGGVASSSAFYFTKRGRAVFSAKDGSSAPSLSELLEEAIDHEGVDDVEELSDVKFLVWTKSAKLAAVTKSFADKFSLNILDSDIVQAPNADTIVPIDSMEVAQGLDDLLAGFREYPEVKAIYANICQGAIPDATWESIIKHIDT